MALKIVDERYPIGLAQRFKPGVGPLTETEITSALVAVLKNRLAHQYSDCGPRAYPGSRNTCDLLIPGKWAIEIKLARPFGDNGRPAERWSENLLYPYPGNTSSLGDCLKLLSSTFSERKGIIVIAYEHSPPKIPVEPAVRAFEVIAQSILSLQLGVRSEVLIEQLVHPVHQQARVFGWEVMHATIPVTSTIAES